MSKTYKTKQTAYPAALRAKGASTKPHHDIYDLRVVSRFQRAMKRNAYRMDVSAVSSQWVQS